VEHVKDGVHFGLGDVRLRKRDVNGHL
jgi:hypothetical protein